LSKSDGNFMGCLLTLEDLIVLTGSSVQGNWSRRTFSVSTDSRGIGPGELFIPLVGEKFDGHQFIDQAMAQGAVGIVSQIPVPYPHILVEDTRAVYQQIARWWREHFVIPVIGITGSVGKTSTKELLTALLGPATLKSLANENNEIGVPKTLLGLDDSHVYAVIEMGMRAFGEIHTLGMIARPTMGLITCVGAAHFERLGSLENIAKAKCELIETLPADGLAVLNGEQPLLRQTAQKVLAGRSLLTFGLDAGEFRGELRDDVLWVEGIPFPLPFAGRHQAMNLLGALAVAHRGLGIDLASLPARLEGLTLPGGRSRTLALQHPADESDPLIFLDETYNAGPEATIAVLEVLAQTPGKRHIAVLGQMKELGEQSKDYHQQVGAHVKALDLDRLFILECGADGEAIQAGACGVESTIHPDHQSLAHALRDYLKPGDRVLFKASRGVRLELVLQAVAAQFSPLATR
jgi:UDP-N-acetylmuramoyl-tripeptide--D-alanyl-D-alanine ligase